MTTQPRYGEIGTLAQGFVVDPDSFRLKTPRQRAGGRVVAEFGQDRDHVVVKDQKTGTEATIRIGGRR